VGRPWERWYRCTACDLEHPVDATRWRCDCGGLLDLAGGSPAFPVGEVRGRPAGLWRWAEALPFEPDDPHVARVAMGEGAAPVVTARLGGREVTATLELASPTLSFKDRGAVVLIATALRVGAERVVVDSSGNAGTAVAAYAARAGLACEVFVAGSASPAKLAQIRAHGAEVHAVDGARRDVAAAAEERVGRGDAFYASHVWNPLFHEGTKTWALDVVAHLGQAPDVAVLPLGNGTLVLGAARGFGQLVEAGVIDRVPVLVAVQADACAPVAAAFEAGQDRVEPVAARPTVAEGIAIAAPARGDQCLAAVRASGGRVLTVTDEEISSARAELAAQGLFVEPTAAAAPAAVSRSGADASQVVAVPLCGAGIKSV
jgi:threonine synthase